MYAYIYNILYYIYIYTPMCIYIYIHLCVYIYIYICIVLDLNKMYMSLFIHLFICYTNHGFVWSIAKGVLSSKMQKLTMG